jgi:hypothetical protein
MGMKWAHSGRWQARRKRVIASGAGVVLLVGGLGAIAGTTTATAAGPTGACFPALESQFDPGNFSGSTTGSGLGAVSFELPSGSSEGTAFMTWSEHQSVTGNTGAGTNGQMSGTLVLTVQQGGHNVSFTSSCILEAGSFAGETEEDPFGSETTRTVIRGLEGEWIGIAANFPTTGQATPVVASLAVWTTSAGPRFHLDLTTATFFSNSCPNETGAGGSIAVGGPTKPGANVLVAAPNVQAGRGECDD